MSRGRMGPVTYHWDYYSPGNAEHRETRELIEAMIFGICVNREASWPGGKNSDWRRRVGGSVAGGC